MDEIHSTGTVQQVQATTPGDCFGLVASAVGGRWRFQLDSLPNVSVVVGLPWPQALIQDGEDVTVEYGYTEAANLYGQAEQGSLVLRDDAGRVILWIGKAGSIGLLTPPVEFTLAPGERPACVVQDDCGMLSGRDLWVAFDGIEGKVGYGDTADIGEYTVVNSGIASAEGTSPCADWFPDSAGVVIAQRSRVF